jgi:hypothetical protein
MGCVGVSAADAGDETGQDYLHGFEEDALNRQLEAPVIG